MQHLTASDVNHILNMCPMQFDVYYVSSIQPFLEPLPASIPVVFQNGDPFYPHCTMYDGTICKSPNEVKI